MRNRLIVLAIALQFGVLAYMAGEREWVLRSGRTVFLRTAPIDPRDPMRGDYVRFGYEISNVPLALCRDGTATWSKRDWREQRRLRDRRVYAIIRQDEEQVAELVALTDRKPDAGTFLRGRVQSVHPHGINVRFGVEAMFTEQGKARALENAPQLQAGVPLNIETRVSDGGLAVLKSYRWEPLGITVQPRRATPIAPPAPNQPARAREAAPLVGATVEVKNHSERPIAIVVRPNGGSFRLVPGEFVPTHRWQPVPADRPTLAPTAEMVKLLRPGETHREELDFGRPEWRLGRVAENGTIGTPVAWDAIPENERWGISFRVEYAPPPREATAGLPHADAIRHTPLRSRAINAAGAID